MSERIAWPGQGRQRTEAAVKYVVLALLLYWCFLLLRPFLIPMVWGVILAVALHPAFVRLERALGGRRKLTAGLLGVACLLLLLVPTIWLSGSMLEGARAISAGVEQGRIQVPPAPASVAEWPVIGPPLFETWNRASVNLGSALAPFHDQIMAAGRTLVGLAKQGAMAVLLTAAALVIAVVLLVKREPCTAFTRGLGTALAGERGEEFVALAASTIGAVAKGVVGVAAIQAVLAAVGLVLAGVPGAGLWALLVMVLAVAQLPPLLVLVPALLYLVATGSGTTTVVLFGLWSVLVSLSDAVLKPLLLGRGSAVPLGVILVGAIGGLLLHGILGLFVGAVAFSIGHRLFLDWMTPPGAPEPGRTAEPEARTQPV